MMATATFVWSDAQVRAALGLTAEGAHALHPPYPAICTDTRDLAPGDLFVALIGERFDGHAFVASALERGASAAVVSRPIDGVPTDRLYFVPDTLQALGDLARFRRRALPARVVGIAGSVGKTGTKEMTRAVLASQRRTHATTANLNNRIGVPLTLLTAPDDAEVVVVEMGTSLRGEMAALTAIADPDIAVIVTVGAEHLEGIGGLDEAIEEELDVLRGLRPEALAIVGDRPEQLAERARALVPSVHVAGRTAGADEAWRAERIALDADGRALFTWRGRSVQLAVPGGHAVDNALLALAVGEAVGVEAGAACAALAEVEPQGLRGEVRRIAQLDLVLDCYNANPQSVEAALDLLEHRHGPGARVALLGSMLELGPTSDDWHERVLESALSRSIDRVIATGEFATAARRIESRRGAVRLGDPSSGVAPMGASRLEAFDDPIEAGEHLAASLRGDEIVLLKGSRGVALERLVPLFEQRFAREEGA